MIYIIIKVSVRVIDKDISRSLIRHCLEISGFRVRVLFKNIIALAVQTVWVPLSKFQYIGKLKCICPEFHYQSDSDIVLECLGNTYAVHCGNVLWISLPECHVVRIALLEYWSTVTCIWRNGRVWSEILDSLGVVTLVSWGILADVSMGWIALLEHSCTVNCVVIMWIYSELITRILVSYELRCLNAVQLLLWNEMWIPLTSLIYVAEFYKCLPWMSLDDGFICRKAFP